MRCFMHSASWVLPRRCERLETCNMHLDWLLHLEHRSSPLPVQMRSGHLGGLITLRTCACQQQLQRNHRFGTRVISQPTCEHWVSTAKRFAYWICRC